MKPLFARYAFLTRLVVRQGRCVGTFHQPRPHHQQLNHPVLLGGEKDEEMSKEAKRKGQQRRMMMC